MQRATERCGFRHVASLAPPVSARFLLRVIARRGGPRILKTGTLVALVASGIALLTPTSSAVIVTARSVVPRG